MHHIAALRNVGVATGHPLARQRRGRKGSAQQDQ